MKYKKDNKLPNTKNVRRKTNPAGVTTHIPPKSTAATSTSSNSKSNYTNTTANNSASLGGNTTPTGMNSVVEQGGMNNSGMNPQQNSRANSTGPNNNVVSTHHGVGGGAGAGGAGAIGPTGSGNGGGGGGNGNGPHSHFGQVPHVLGGAHNNCLPLGGAPPQLKQEQPYGLTSL